MRIVTVSAAAALALALAAPAQGQLLKQLEERLRQGINAVAPPGAANPADAARGPGYLGLSATAADDGRAGVVVERVRPESPAEAAGLKRGDRITAIDDQPIASLDDMDRALAAVKAGQQLKIRLTRGAESQTIAVTLAAAPPPANDPAIPRQPANDPFLPREPAGDEFRPREEDPRAFAPRGDDGSGRASLGITVAPLTENDRLRYGLPARRGGLITALKPGGPAERAGLPIGGLIVAVDGVRVESSDEVVDLIRGARPGQEIELTYYQQDRLFRKAVRLATSSEPLSVLRPRDGIGEPPPADGDRPILRRLGQAVEGFVRSQEGGAAPGVVVETGEADALRRQVNQLQQQVQELQARLDALERRAGPGAGNRPPPPPPQPELIPPQRP